MKKHTNLVWLGLLLILGLWIALPTAALSSGHSPAQPIAAGLIAPLAIGSGGLARRTKIVKRMAAAIPRGLERKDDSPEQQLEREIKAIKGEIIKAIEGKADAATVRTMQAQLDALDLKLSERHVGGGTDRTLLKTLEENEELKKYLHDKPRMPFMLQLDAKQVRELFERKTTIDSSAVGAATTGVLQIDRTTGIVQEARQALTIRGALTARPTSQQYVDFIKVNSPLTNASPQIETHTKKENAVTFTTVSEKVRTLATWIPASRQILDDFTELDGFLRSSLPYYVDAAEEAQLLSGAGTGEDLHGLITQATAFDTSLLSAPAGWTRIDVIARAIQQVTTAKELPPTFIVLHPTDFWAMRLTKNSQGDYILGNPMEPVVRNIFGLTPIITTAITVGHFLLGSGNPAAAEIRDRLGMTVEIANQHEDYFTRNMIAIRAEKRVALVVYRPASFITGSFTTSP